MSRAAKFWDRMARRYAEQPIANQENYERKLEMTRALFTPESEVLEFGCGTGSTALLHAPFANNIRAIDFSAEMITIARDKATEAGVENVIFEQASIDTVEGEEADFDVVLGLNVLHLVEDRKATLDKIYDLTKPGGFFVSSTVCITGLWALLKIVTPLAQSLGLMPMLRFFTADTLRGEVQSAGFEIVEDWMPEKSMGLFLIAKKPLDG